MAEQAGGFALLVEAGVGHQFAAAAEDVEVRLDLPVAVHKAGNRFAVLQHFDRLAGAKRVGVLNDPPVALGQRGGGDKRQAGQQPGYTVELNPSHVRNAQSMAADYAVAPPAWR